ncbi:hypothetical protein RJZ56_004257 [Blastomyces dermatitidis]|uniref:Type 1 phosphatases regulator n=3 Tax=Blastomyces TaxID=229219 RepID=A0A179V4Z4_BLAGS|nr:uncharacterized protein BDBG_09547 [Blastomyces gilchristii SLH14081]XP_045273841.1 uncharacterized protein BDCG_01374 [Blastomyces dermatitidis ER-3]EEQ86254.1 hypothetical protein BDCG_01374 [Blastomyces dermatitidis ER-3]EGE85325.1 hypothetical protein BDDG_08270 [Blastomyces dermatitidis ATCC 18188]OAT14558.1 hypothetical protein BDBG_09547 [Blastomyces gilchristii SLH14081]
MSRDRGAMTQRLQTGGTNSPGTMAQVETTVRHQQGRITGRLRLRAEANTEVETESETGTGQASRRGIRWAEDVVDNEELGRKSSKVCCIFHKARPVGESSSESSSDSSSDSSDSDSDVDTGEARMANGRVPANRMHRHRYKCHNHSNSQHDGPAEQKGGDDGDGGSGSDSCCDSGSGDASKRRRIRIHRQRRRPRPNAYERMPKSSSKKKE